MAKSRKKQEKKTSANTKEAPYATLANANRASVDAKNGVSHPSAESVTETRSWSQENKK